MKILSSRFTIFKYHLEPVIQHFSPANYWKTLILVGLTSLAIYARFHDSFFKTGDQKLIEAWGDGLKTYTNTIYHIRHDSTYTFFEGMNYPYGEHIMAATELPGIAIFLKFVNEYVFTVSDAFVVDFIHWFLMFSLLLCSWFIYLIFSRLKVEWWFAIPVAIGLTFLSPQFFRLKSHFGLGVLFVIPMILYLLMKFEEQKHWKTSLWMALAVFLSAQFHFYFFAIVAAAILTYLISSYAFSIIRSSQPRYFQNGLKYAGHFGIMVGIPFLFFLFWMILNDPVVDRSPKPFGFLYYRANWEGIFLLKELPFYQWINDHIIEIEKTAFEGRIYVGMISAAFCLVMLLRWIFRKLKGGIFDFYFPQQVFLYSLFFTGLILVLFASGFPFTLPGLEFLVDYSGPLQQFRSIGRFGWVFYFTINIIALTSLYQAIINWKQKHWKVLSFLLIIGLLGYEGWQNSLLRDYKLTRVPHFEKGKEYTMIDSIDFSRYQAIIPIPYYNIGSNNLVKGAQGFGTQRSFVLSAQTGLPITAAMLTRTSRSQTYNQWQLVTAPYRSPKIFEAYPSDKPLLLIWWKKLKEPELGKFKHLKEGAQLIYEENSLQLYEMPQRVFQERIDNKQAEIELALNKDSLFLHKNIRSTDSLPNFVYENFDAQSSENQYFGAGGFDGDAKLDNVLYEGRIPNLKTSQTLIISLWVNIDRDRFGSSLNGIFEEFDESGKLLQRKMYALGRNLMVMEPNGWVLSEKRIKAKSSKSRIKFTVKWKHTESAPVHLDELLIRPLNTDVYQKREGTIWKNNQHFMKAPLVD